MKNLFSVAMAMALLAVAGCGDRETAGQDVDHAATEAADASEHDMADMAAPSGGMMMTPEDPGGFTAEGFTFHTRPSSKHVVRLEAPGGDTWRAAASGQPYVKEIETRTETTPEGKTARIFVFEMLQSGNAAIPFERLEDGEVEATRTINFMVH